MKLNWSFESVQIYNKNIRKKCCFNNAVFIRWKRHMLTRGMLIADSLLHLFFENLYLFLTYVNYDWYVVSRLLKYSEFNWKAKCLNTCVNLSSSKPMQVHTANYRHLWSPVNPLMSGGNKRSNILKAADLFKYIT